MSESVLAAGGFWRDLLERAGRQAAQTALPLVAAIGAAGTINAKAVTVAVAGAVIFTIVKALATVAVTVGEDWYWVLLDRAVPAAAGTVLGMWPVDALNITRVDWVATAWAAAAAGLVALLSYYVTPPTAALVAQGSRAPLEPTEVAPLEPTEVAPLEPTEVL